MINLDGANLIFAHLVRLLRPASWSIWPRNTPTSSSATRRRCGTRTSTRRTPARYFGYLNQAHYVDGVAAGLSTKSNKLGFVAAKPIALGAAATSTRSLLGARKVNPNATVQVIFTGDWSLPVREAEATNALVDAGCDVITCHVDGPKVVIETAEKRGVKTCGHNASQAPLAPKGFITGAEYKWETIYKGYADELAKGEPLPNFVARRLRQGHVQNTPSAPAPAKPRKKAATAAIADLKAKKPIYVGPLKDNKGKVVIDKTYDNYDPFLEQMNYLLEGVVGSIT